MNKQVQAEKLTALKHIITWVPQDGWTDEALENAAKASGKTTNYYKLLFPKGIIEIIQLFISQCDRHMMDEYKKRIKTAEKPNTTARIKLALYCRIIANAEYKDVVARTASYFAQPWNSCKGAEMGWNTVDLIWKECGGDKSTDFNYYTKRGLLFSAYAAVLHYWSSDESENFMDTHDFIDRTIDNIVKVGGTLGKFTKMFNK